MAGFFLTLFFLSVSQNEVTQAMSQNEKRPVFSSDTARKAQPLAVAKRRETDRQLRLDLAHLVSVMSPRLRLRLVAALPIRAVEALLVNAREGQ